MNVLILAPFLLLLAFGGHAICDYGQQSAYMAEFKVRSDRNPDWFVTLAAHCLIHAVHFAIDDAKGQKRFSYRVDQALHYGCKIVWVGVILAVAAGAAA